MKYISCLVFALFAFFNFSSVAFGVIHPEHLENEDRLHFQSSIKHRKHRDVRWYAPEKSQAALKNFMHSSDIMASSPKAADAWKIMWDYETGVPSRIFGVGIEAPQVQTSSKNAEVFALNFLNRHIKLLAPGSQLSDFKVVTNVLTKKMRIIGIKQFHQNREVIGGQVHFKFKNNRLFVIGSEAMPHVNLPPLEDTLLSDGDFHVNAREWIQRDWNATDLQVEGLSAAKILPFIAAGGDIQYFSVVETTVSSRDPLAKWTVYLDSSTGEPIARKQLLHFYDATIKINASDRWPGRGRIDYPAEYMTTQFPLGVETTDAQGRVSWGGEANTEVMLGIEGDEVRVTNRAGPEFSEIKEISDGGQVIWDHRNDEQKDAQLSSFVYANLVKTYAANIAPEMAWLKNEKIRAYVNIADGECNAYSDGTTINFLRASNACENTARLSDVVYHEFGHSFHAHALLPSVGAWDTALSEGASDYISATITDDPAMGIGFFGNGQPLRHLNESRNRVWPDDIGEEHQTGIIFGGAMWDLRTLLIQRLGAQEGIRIADELWYQALRTSYDIPSSYVELIAADDDDGNLENGTPNICDINAALALHGLGDPLGFYGINKPRKMDNFVIVDQKAGFSCPGNQIESMNVDWEIRDNANLNGTIEMEAANTGFEAMLPAAEAGIVVNYQVTIEFSDGTSKRFPENEASPWYEHFVGRTIPLYCTSFENAEQQANWTHELLAGEEREGANDWQVGEPLGLPGSGDPSVAADGNLVFGNDLGGGDYNGMYQPEKVNALTSPSISTKGYKNIRLQYKRWLNVEDGFYDQATIYSNDTQLWQNLDSGEDGKKHHQDKQWRFHDLDLSNTVVDDQVQVRFELSTDGGLELGGWTIDDLCIVALDPEQPVDLNCPNCIAPTVVESCGGCSSSGNSTTLPALLLLAGAVFLRRRRTQA